LAWSLRDAKSRDLFEFPILGDTACRVFYIDKLRWAHYCSKHRFNTAFPLTISGSGFKTFDEGDPVSFEVEQGAKGAAAKKRR